MAKRHWPNNEILPAYNAADRFCYFYDLIATADTNTSLGWHKVQLYNAAENDLINSNQSTFNITPDNNSDIILSAINFLNLAAQNERAKELNLIATFEQKLRDLKSKEINKILDRLQNPNNDWKTFYSDLTLAINALRHSLEDTQARLNQLMQTNRVTRKDLMSDQYLYRMPTDIQGLLRNATGIKAKEEYDSFASKIQEKVITYITQELTKYDGGTFVQNPIPTLTALMISFSKYIQHEKSLYDPNNKKTLDEFYKEQEETIYNHWLEYDDKILKTVRGEINDAVDAMTDLSKMLNLQSLKQGTKEYNERTKLFDARRAERTKSRSKKLPRGAQMLEKAYGKKFFNDNIKYIDWQIDLSQKSTTHGNFAEYIAALLEGGRKIGGTAAEDVMTFMISGELSTDGRRAIEEQLSNGVQILEEDSLLQRKNRLDDTITNLDSTHKALQDTYTEMQNILDAAQLPNDLFIFHESLKLYERVEERKTQGFEGRELSILSAFDKIYSLASDTGTLTLLSKDVMYSIVLNLSKLAVGQGSLKEPVENYLSIFAGLLLFDDLQTTGQEIAENALNQITHNNVHNIHLYLLQDLYVPSSMILTFIAESLKEGYTKISSSYGAKAKIDTSQADAVISNYLQARSNGQPYGYKADWPKIGDSVASQTKVEITFLTSFITFIADLNRQLHG